MTIKEENNALIEDIPDGTTVKEAHDQGELTTWYVQEFALDFLKELDKSCLNISSKAPPVSESLEHLSLEELSVIMYALEYLANTINIFRSDLLLLGLLKQAKGESMPDTAAIEGRQALVLFKELEKKLPGIFDLAADGTRS